MEYSATGFPTLSRWLGPHGPWLSALEEAIRTHAVAGKDWRPGVMAGILLVGAPSWEGNRPTIEDTDMRGCDFVAGWRFDRKPLMEPDQRERIWRWRRVCCETIQAYSHLSPPLVLGPCRGMWAGTRRRQKLSLYPTHQTSPISGGALSWQRHVSKRVPQPETGPWTPRS